jgi:flavodoxin
MKVLIVYFSLSGHTKKAAEAMAGSFGNTAVDLEEIRLKGKLRDMMIAREAILNGDLSAFDFNPKILDVAPYDLICIGAPVYGGRPAGVFDGYLKNAAHLKGKSAAAFGTCWATAGKPLQIMKNLIEAKGAKILDQMILRGIFGVNVKKAAEFGQRLKALLK